MNMTNAEPLTVEADRARLEQLFTLVRVGTEYGAEVDGVCEELTALARRLACTEIIASAAAGRFTRQPSLYEAVKNKAADLEAAANAGLSAAVGARVAEITDDEKPMPFLGGAHG